MKNVKNFDEFTNELFGFGNKKREQPKKLPVVPSALVKKNKEDIKKEIPKKVETGRCYHCGESKSPHRLNPANKTIKQFICDECYRDLEGFTE